MSELGLASRRANLVKARAAGREKIYRPTEKRQAASRANMARAIAARKAGNAEARFNALGHGISTKDVAGSVARMGEDPREYLEHHALFERIFVPLDDDERNIVRGLADASWKRLRFFRVQAIWELTRLKKTFLAFTTLQPISAAETERRAFILSRAVNFDLDYLDYVDQFQSEIQSHLRCLLKKRSGGKIRFKVFKPTRGIKDDFTMSLDQWIDRALKSKK
jgi:hypothetical protein